MNTGNLHFKVASLPEISWISVTIIEQLLLCLSKNSSFVCSCHFHFCYSTKIVFSYSHNVFSLADTNKIESESTMSFCFIFAWKRNEYANFRLSNTWFIGKVKVNVCISEMSSVSHAMYNKFSFCSFHQHAQFYAIELYAFVISLACHRGWTFFGGQKYREIYYIKDELLATFHCINISKLRIVTGPWVIF